MASAQQLWAPIPTTIHSSIQIDDATAAENISTFLQIHHGELPGDSNATASLVRLIQGLRDESRLAKTDPSVPAPVVAPKSPKKKRKHDKVEAEASIVADITTEPAADETAITEGGEPVKKKKKKERKEKKEKKHKAEKVEEE